MLLDNEFTGDMRVENEVISLINAGHEVFVLCFNYGDKKAEEDFHGAKILRHKISTWKKNKMKGLTNTLFDFYSHYWAKLALNGIEKYSLDVIHAHDLYLVKAGILAKKKSKREIKLVADLHENYPQALRHYKFANTFPGNLLISIPKWERAEKEWLSDCDAIITVIEEAKGRYMELEIPQSKLWIVANYINRNTFSKQISKKIRMEHPDAFILLYTGGFDYHRGLEHVINAIPEISKIIPNIKLVLVGTGKNLDELKQLTINLELEKKVIFEGWQLANELPSYMAEADICLIPHLKTVHTDHTIPHKLFHYMYMSKPIVVTNCNPIARIVNDASSGIVYESNNSDQLAHSIFEVYNNPKKIEQYSVNGYNAVKEKYNWVETSTELINLYSKL